MSEFDPRRGPEPPNGWLTAPRTIGPRRYLGAGIWRIDLALALAWAPGRAWRTSLRERPRDPGRPRVDLTYGETRWRSILRLLDRAGAGPGDRLLELGSGTGRLSMIAAQAYGLDATGIELIPSFVRRGNRICGALGLARCRFVEADLFSIPWAEATLLYVTATAFSEETLTGLAEKCDELSPGAQIIVTSHKIERPSLALEGMEMVDFSSGPIAAFFYRRR